MRPRKPRIVAKAEFTRDMVESMLKHFDEYASGGILTIEIVDSKGLFFSLGQDTRCFLGLARFQDGQTDGRLRH